MPTAPLGVLAVMTGGENQLTASEAGALIRERRKARGLTQEQLVERTGMSSQSYLSAFEKGRYHIGRSEHFPAVVRELHLSEDDIRAINPSAVITMAAPLPTRSLSDAERRGWKLPPEAEPEIPEALQAAADQYGHGPHAPLAEKRWLHELADLDFREEPETPEDWLAVYVRLSKLIDPK